MGGLTLLCMITRIAMSGCSPWFNEWIDMCGYGIGAEGFIVVIGCVLHPSCDISRIFLTCCAGRSRILSLGLIQECGGLSRGVALCSQGEDFVRDDVYCHPHICVRVRCWISLKILWLGL